MKLLIVAAVAACGGRDASEQPPAPAPTPPLVAPKPPAPPAITATATATIDAFLAASRRNDDRSAWLAPKVVLRAQCETKEMEALYAWLWLDAARVTWTTQKTCAGNCCDFTATAADGPPALDGVLQRMCAISGRITEIRMRCER